MPRVFLNVSVGALLVGALSVPAATALAQTPGRVRVVYGPAPILRWLKAPDTDVLREVDRGTTLEVLDEEMGWYWVVVPPDAHGTRKVGWIRAVDVEPVVAEPGGGETAASASLEVRRAEPGSAEGTSPATDAAPSTIVEDVTITETPGDTAAPSSATAAAKAPVLDDVHFERDRYALRPGDMAALRAAVAALKADPALMVNIEGHTCSLGTAEYNLALGARRADAVKNFLVSEGIAAERLHTVSLGEEHPKHDNSSEETRRLNRRVELVPDVRP